MELTKTNFVSNPFAKCFQHVNIGLILEPFKLYMFRHSCLFVFVLIVHFSFGQKVYPKNDFVPPLPIPLILSGTFGELRTNHFHSGIDIKTQGREGVPVIAVADGRIVRIKVSPYGFGNAIYLRHSNGYTTVYAHLQSFDKSIEEYVRSQQYLKKSFSVELFPSASQFSFKQGDTIALSGNSGGSGGPHLHFEIRDSRTEKIINPLLFYDVKDNRKPELLDLQFYDFEKDELKESRKYNIVKSSEGNFYLAGSGIIEVKGRPGFAVRTFDRLNKANNKNGVFSVELRVNNQSYHKFKMETFAFSETRYINSHIDFGQKGCCGRTMNKLLIEPNNRLSIYQNSEKMNLPVLMEDSIYSVEILVKDIAGNLSTLKFKIKKKTDRIGEGIARYSELPLFKYGQTNFFKNDFVDLVIPDGALYKDVNFEYAEKPRCKTCFSPIYTLGSADIPIHKYFNVKIKPSLIFEGDKSKLGIASFKKGRIADFEGGKYENGFVVGRTRQLGDFAVVVDTIPPLIQSVNFKNGANVSRLGKLKVKIADNLAGIDKFSGEMDGEWVLMAYDAKKRLLILDLNKENFKKGKHELKITVRDGLKNISVANFTLIL